MSYTTLGPEAFFDETGKPSMVSLSYYCNNIASRKFEYTGYIDGYDFYNLSFNNIVKADIIEATDIVYQYPDLIEVGVIYYKIPTLDKLPDIGNIKTANIFFISPYHGTLKSAINFISNYVKIINEHTLIINGKELKVTKKWEVLQVNYKNYKEFGL